MERISVADILRGTGLGRMQSVGHMGVLPIIDIDGAQDDTFAPPGVDVDNRSYGSVNIYNDDPRPTIVPTGAGWMSKEKSQDHAIGSALIVPGSSRAKVSTAMCIESQQGGYMRRGTNQLVVLPVSLRASALALRGKSEYGKLWGSISATSSASGHRSGRSHI